MSITIWVENKDLISFVGNKYPNTPIPNAGIPYTFTRWNKELDKMLKKYKLNYITETFRIFGRVYHKEHWDIECFKRTRIKRIKEWEGK